MTAPVNAGGRNRGIAEPQTLTCATCGRRARVSGPRGRDAAQAAGWRWSLNGKTAWCGEHSEEALSGKSVQDPVLGTQARF